MAGLNDADDADEQQQNDLIALLRGAPEKKKTTELELIRKAAAQKEREYEERKAKLDEEKRLKKGELLIHTLRLKHPTAQTTSEQLNKHHLYRYTS
jgi:hypothetical protein